MTLRGSVQDFPLRAVLDMLAQTKKTGELQLRTRDQLGALGIADGRVVTAVLGEDDPLLALGAIFALDGAEFEFTPWDDAPPANLDAASLDELLGQAADARRQRDEELRRAEEAREAARKKAEEEREAERKRMEEIRTLIPSDDVPLRLSERAVEQGPVTLTSERWRLVLAVNGERDVNGIASMLHQDDNATLTSLAALVRDGVIEVVPGAAFAAGPALPEAPAEPAPPAFEPAADAFETAPDAISDYAAADSAPAADVPPATADWITPDQAVPAADWSITAEPGAPTSEVAPQWSPPAEAAPPAPDWITPEVVEPAPGFEDRLSALSGIFGPAPSDTESPPSAEPPVNSWVPPASASDQWGTPPEPTPTAERWSAPPRAEPGTPATSDDPWGAPPSPTPPQGAWTPPAPAPENDTWVAPPPPPAAPAQRPWSAPESTGTSSADPWGSASAFGARTDALRIPDISAPPVEEWSPPPAAPPEKKKRGLFGFGRAKPAPPPVAGQPLPTAGVVGSRVGMIAALANALIAEYNTGQYGKGRIEERIANLLMRVDEQADPIDRPLPIVDDRIDVESLEREHLADAQALPYLALLVTTIFADAEKTFGKDKAKKGYKAAQKSVMLGDASVLSSPELAGKLPKV